MSAPSRTSTSTTAELNAEHYIVVDTSVLLAAGAKVLTSYGSAVLVLSSVVIDELEGKRTTEGEVGFQARNVLRAIDELSIAAEARGAIGEPWPLTDEGGLLVHETNHRDQAALPEAMRDPASNDKRILSIAAAIKAEHPEAEVSVLSRDLPMRLHARAELGLKGIDYTGDKAREANHTGVVDLDGPGGPGNLDADMLATLRSEGRLDLSAYAERSERFVEIKAMPVNTGLILGGMIGRVEAPGVIAKITGSRRAFSLEGRSAEQRIAIDHLLNGAIPIVSLGGRAGTGKTILAVAAGLESVMEQRTHKKVVVFRNMYAVGGQDLGYLPGSEAEKMDPWTRAIIDALEAFCGPEVIEEITERALLEVQPMTHLRGRTLHDTYVVVDEAQNLELSVLSTVMSRIAESSKCVLTHDVAQRDNLRVGRYDGIAAVIDKLTGSELFAHTTLVRSERSRAAELVSRLLDAE